MKSKIRIFTVTAIMGIALTSYAQNTNSGYFNDGYNYRYQMNPAFGNEMNFISIPGIGNINVGLHGNLNLTDVLHTVDGKTVLFTNPEVSSSFLNDLHNFNRLTSDVKVNIISAGFKSWGGYNTISINARAELQTGVPKTLFSLAKEGVMNKYYDLSGIGANANAFAEIGLNHSRDINSVPGLRVGAGVKFLIGLANFEAETKTAFLNLDQNQWIANTDATINANLGKFRFKTKSDDDGKDYVSGADLKGDGSIGPNGFGMTFDLGLNYKWKDFNFSAAIVDLGWISYFDTRQASTNGMRTFNTDSYIFNANENAENSFKNEWDNFKTGLEDLYHLTDNGNVGTRTIMPGATLNFGVDYSLPMYKRLHFGLLSSTHIISDYTWTELRVSANVNPVDCFSATADFAVSNYGCGFGWLLNFNHRWFNIFLGMDYTPFKLAKQGVPLKSNASANFGMNIPF